ncbi:transposase [Candidatus Woesearchaeota archaeon]|nr:transposase [Candidatus Woesearchaeota archaeon]
MLREYFGKSGRRSISFLDYALSNGYIKNKPHFNTIFNYYKDPELTRILKYLIEQSGTPLREIESDFMIDASGFSTSLFGRWFDIRIQENSKKRIFKKAHVTSGTKSNIITAIEITPGYYADSPQFCGLVKITSKNFEMKEISGDKAYSGRKNLETASEVGAIPYIVFKSNARTRARGSEIWRKMKIYFDEHKEEFMQHYHKRSNAETVFHMIKRKFGSHLNSKSEIGQINEILCRALAHNICVLIQEMFELQISLNFINCAKLEVIRVQA